MEKVYLFIVIFKIKLNEYCFIEELYVKMALNGMFKGRGRV